MLLVFPFCRNQTQFPGEFWPRTLAGSILTADDIKNYLKKKIADFKIPRTVAFHDQLPREDSGKIFKRRLKEPYWKAAGRKI